MAENVGNLGWNYHVFQVAKGKSQNTDLYISLPNPKNMCEDNNLLCIRNPKTQRGE